MLDEVARDVAGQRELGSVWTSARHEAGGAVVARFFDGAVEVLDAREVTGEIVAELGALAAGVLDARQAPFDVPAEAVRSA